MLGKKCRAHGTMPHLIITLLYLHNATSLGNVPFLVKPEGSESEDLVLCTGYYTTNSGFQIYIYLTSIHKRNILYILTNKYLTYVSVSRKMFIFPLSDRIFIIKAIVYASALENCI